MKTPSAREQTVFLAEGVCCVEHTICQYRRNLRKAVIVLWSYGIIETKGTGIAGCVWMQIRQFEYILEIARQKSIRQAAENLFVSQQALSEMLKKVEDEMGFSIFQRTNKGVVPTAKGAKVLKDMAQIVQTVHDWALYKEKTGVRIILQYLIGDLLLDNEFQETLHRLPQYDIHMETMGIQDMLNSIEKGEICATLFYVSKSSEEYWQIHKACLANNCKMRRLADNDTAALCALMQKESCVNEKASVLTAEHLNGMTMKLNRDMTPIKPMQDLCRIANLRMDGLPRSLKPIDVVVHTANTFTLLPYFIAKENIYVKNGTVLAKRLSPELEEEWDCYIVYQEKWETLLQPLLLDIYEYFDNRCPQCS